MKNLSLLQQLQAIIDINKTVVDDTTKSSDLEYRIYEIDNMKVGIPCNRVDEFDNTLINIDNIDNIKQLIMEINGIIIV